MSGMTATWMVSGWSVWMKWCMWGIARGCVAPGRSSAGWGAAELMEILNSRYVQLHD